MQRRPSIPCVLTIAGSDSGGGAGIQADLKTWCALGVHGTTAITCVTAQNPKGVRVVQAVRPDVVRQQIQAVGCELRPSAVKTGMLYSAGVIRAVAEVLRELRLGALVVDPVMIATSGARLLQTSAIRALGDELLPLACLMTPNLDEARCLLDREVRHPEAMREAARELHGRYGCAVLVKGGHLGGPEAVDVFWDGEEELLLSAPRVRGVRGHGTGCTYAAAIVGYLAKGLSLGKAVVLAKEHMTRAFLEVRWVGRHPILGTWSGVGGPRGA